MEVARFSPVLFHAPVANLPLAEKILELNYNVV
jgi:hypothetical protein